MYSSNKVFVYIRDAMSKSCIRTCPPSAVWSESLLGAFRIAKDVKFLHADDKDRRDWAHIAEGTFSVVTNSIFNKVLVYITFQKLELSLQRYLTPWHHTLFMGAMTLLRPLVSWAHKMIQSVKQPVKQTVSQLNDQHLTTSCEGIYIEPSLQRQNLFPTMLPL